MSKKAQEIKVTRTQTEARLETRMLKVLKAPTEYYDLSLGDLLEGIVLHAYQGPFRGASPEENHRLEKKFIGWITMLHPAIR